MAVITATDSLAGLAGYVNACISSALRSFAVDYWPPHHADVGVVTANLTLTRVAATAHPRVLSAANDRSYMDDYYYRIHLTPAVIDLGNLVTAQTRTVDVWNAWPDRALTLDSVSASGAGGISIVGPGALPLVFQPLQQRTWTLTVTTDGQPVIAAKLSWLFAGIDPVTVQITGNRLNAWTVAPTWQQGILERLEWLSEVQQGSDGSSDAYPLRDTPRRSWEFDLIVGKDTRRLLESTLYDWAARNWAFPVAVDASQLSAAVPAGASSIPLATSNLDYAIGSLIMLWRSPTQYELAEVEQIAINAVLLVRPTVSAWPIGTRVYPVRIARLAQQPRLQRRSTRVVSAHVEMTAVEECSWPALPPATTYAGYPVLEHQPEVSKDPTAIYERKLEMLDDEIGPVSIDDFTGLPWPQQSHAWKLQGRAARAQLRSLAYYLAGRVNRLWVPTWQDDLELASTAPGTGLVITVAWAGYTRYAHGQPGRKHLRIELVDGTVFYRAITNWAEVDAATEQLVLDAALGQTVTPAQIAQISYLGLCSLAGDTVEIQHDTDSEGSAQCNVKFAQVSGDE